MSNIPVPRILIVDDEPAISSAVQFALTQNGFETQTASLAAEALQHTRQRAFDLAILDVGLPDMSGFELCKLIQQSHSLPVIFLTARSDEIDRVVGLEIGADDYVCKPFSPRELVARVKIILKRNQPASAATAKKLVGFEWDEEARSICWQSQLLNLTRYEYDVLMLLLNAPNKIFTRDEIMEKVWVAPDHSLDRTVDTHIKTLRAKLRAIDDSQEVIITHRGLGYSLSNGRSKP